MELQFTVGEAITSGAVGTSSGAARDPWTCTEDHYTPPQSTFLKCSPSLYCAFNIFFYLLMNFAISEVHTTLIWFSSIVARLLSTLHDHIQLYTSSRPNEIHGYLFCLTLF